MTTDTAELERAFSRLTDEGQSTLESEFERIAEQYVELVPHIKDAGSIAANDDGNVTLRSFAETESEEFEAWRREKPETAEEIRQLCEQFGDLLSQIESVPDEPMELPRAELANVIEEDLTEMYWNLLVVAAGIYPDEMHQQNGGDTDDSPNRSDGFVSKIKEKLNQF